MPRLGVPARAFCYPGGYVDQIVRDMVEQAGYTVAVTTEPGVNYPGVDPLRLSRVGLSWEAPRHLALKLAFYGLTLWWRAKAAQRRAPGPAGKLARHTLG